jgi:hypothetical protein
MTRVVFEGGGYPHGLVHPIKGGLQRSLPKDILLLGSGWRVESGA